MSRKVIKSATTRNSTASASNARSAAPIDSEVADLSDEFEAQEIARLAVSDSYSGRNSFSNSDDAFYS